MRIGVDGRSLVGARRGIGHFVAGVLEALAAMPDVDVRVLQPRSRAVHGAAALLGRPRLDRRLGGVDVVWLPAPAPVAVSRDTPYVVTFHDLGFLERPGDLTAYERLWHRLARPAVLARRSGARDRADRGHGGPDRRAVRGGARPWWATGRAIRAHRRRRKRSRRCASGSARTSSTSAPSNRARRWTCSSPRTGRSSRRWSWSATAGWQRS